MRRRQYRRLEDEEKKRMHDDLDKDEDGFDKYEEIK